MMPSNHLIFCCFLLLSSIFGSIRVFSSESAFPIAWPKYWNFSFSISPSNECSRLISFRIEWFDLLAVQGSCKSLLQNQSLKTLILWHSVQFSSVAQLCPTLCNPMNNSTPGLPVHQQLPEFTQTHVHRVGDAIQPSQPLSSPSPPAPNPSQHQSLFQWVSSLHQVAKVLVFHFSIIPSNKHPGQISCRMDWLDLLAVHGTLKSLLQHHSSKASILQHSAFFKVQLSHHTWPLDKP